MYYKHYTVCFSGGSCASAFEVADDAGKGMTLDEAVALALGERKQA